MFGAAHAILDAHVHAGHVEQHRLRIVYSSVELLLAHDVRAYLRARELVPTTVTIDPLFAGLPRAAGRGAGGAGPTSIARLGQADPSSPGLLLFGRRRTGVHLDRRLGRGFVR